MLILGQKFMWVKVFKNGPSKICRRQPVKYLKWYGLSRPYHFKYFKGCSTNFTLSIREYLDSFVNGRKYELGTSDVFWLFWKVLQLSINLRFRFSNNFIYREIKIYGSKIVLHFQLTKSFHIWVNVLRFALHLGNCRRFC